MIIIRAADENYPLLGQISRLQQHPRMQIFINLQVEAHQWSAQIENNHPNMMMTASTVKWSRRRRRRWRWEQVDFDHFDLSYDYDDDDDSGVACGANQWIHSSVVFCVHHPNKMPQTCIESGVWGGKKRAKVSKSDRYSCQKRRVCTRYWVGD